MAEKRPLVLWTLANAIGMMLGFLAFLEVLMFIGFGLNFKLHWSSDAVEGIENPERLFAIGLAVGLPLAGAIFTLCQAFVLRGRLPQVRYWILAGPVGFASVIVLVWPFREIWGKIPGPVEPFTIVGGGLLMSAVLQWLSLRRQDIEANRWFVLWIIGLPIGRIMCTGIYLLINLVVSVSWAGEVALVGFFIGGTAAAVSGTALFRSISTRNKPVDA